MTLQHLDKSVSRRDEQRRALIARLTDARRPAWERRLDRLVQADLARPVVAAHAAADWPADSDARR